MESIRPFVKWAGGKASLIGQLTKYYPVELENNEIETYMEPFVGGGAVLINILQNYKIKNVYAFDINKDLINCYKVIQNNVDDLIKELKIKQDKFLNTEIENREKLFYDIRNEYNSYSLDEKEQSVKRASEFIFLNRTCFNGLYRVNKNGQFNVPFGKYKNPKICDEVNLINLSKLIKNVIFIYVDYRESENYIENSEKTFMYFDPPYRPLKRNNGFTSYTKEDFDDVEQMKLSQFYRMLDSHGVKLMLSNSNPKNTNPNDNFFEDLYDNFNINEVYANRMINSDKNGRGKISELLITNYEECIGCTQQNVTMKMAISN